MTIYIPQIMNKFNLSKVFSVLLNITVVFPEKKNPIDVLYYFSYDIEEKNARTRTGEVHSKYPL